jgi:hypothetical protein
VLFQFNLFGDKRILQFFEFTDIKSAVGKGGVNAVELAFYRCKNDEEKRSKAHDTIKAWLRNQT